MDDFNIIVFGWITIATLIVIVFLTIFILLSIQFVPQGQHYTIERLGKYVKTLQPGINFIVPMLDKITNKVDMRERVMDVPSQEVITRDNAMITVDGVVFYRVIDAANATYQISHLDKAIEHITTTNLRTVMGSMDLDDLLSKREEINASLFQVVDEATDPWGVKIIRIEIKDISPPKDLVDAMAGQMKAERNKRAYILEAEGKKRAQVLEAEAKKEAAILEAEGIKQAEILNAQARQETILLDAESHKKAADFEAHARERMAEAEAKATTMLSQAIMNGDIQAVNYFMGLKYIESLQHIASADNQKVIMMPFEASQLIGSLAGIGEVAKEVFSRQQPTKPQPTATVNSAQMEKETEEKELKKEINHLWLT
jgi:regulator of protease activity HflC (stomatin/prohibitin superfamily)